MKKPVAKPVKPVVAKSVPAKTVAKPVKQAAPVAKSKGDPTQDYRGQRKHTVVFLESYIADPAALRARIGSTKKGPVTLDELMQYLREIENDPRKSQMRGQPGPDGKPRKPGRPRKDQTVAAAPAKVNSKATLAAAAKGAALPPKKGPAAPSVKKPVAKPIKKK